MRILLIYSLSIFFYMSANALTESEIKNLTKKCSTNKKSDSCYNLGKYYIDDSKETFAQGFEVLRASCNPNKNKKSCDWMKNKIDELELAQNQCVESLRYGACEKLEPMCEKIKYGAACGMLAVYWIKQKDNRTAIEYANKSCDYGDKIGCSLVGKINDINETSERVATKEAQLKRIQNEDDEKRRQQNISNTLQAVSGMLNSNNPREPTNKETNCDTRPIYDIYGKFKRYETTCR